MRQLRVENTLYNLPDEVWRQVNDLLSKAEGRKQLTQEMLKDEIPVDQPTEETGNEQASGSGPEPPDEPKPLGEDLADENSP